MKILKSQQAEISEMFKILQMEPTEDLAAIRAQYIRLASKAHPDKGGSQDEMASINTAYSAVRDLVSLGALNSVFKCQHCKDTGFVDAQVGLSNKIKKIKCKYC